jgi:hypothetical protein
MEHEPIKYPRTFHLPWSPGATDDDKTLDDTSIFEGKVVVITEKVDGENTTIYPNGKTHARSLSSGNHPSRDMVRSMAGYFSTLGLPRWWRFMGENAYARHSIDYDALPGFFLLFGVADADNISRPWSEVEEWAQLLEIPTVPVLYRGPWDQAFAEDLYPFKSKLNTHGLAEGYVVRVENSFPMEEFNSNTGKFVRSNHVTTSDHWMHSELIPNTLA